jgi:hypothetical protein
MSVGAWRGQSVVFGGYCSDPSVRSGSSSCGDTSRLSCRTCRVVDGEKRCCALLGGRYHTPEVVGCTQGGGAYQLARWESYTSLFGCGAISLYHSHTSHTWSNRSVQTGAYDPDSITTHAATRAVKLRRSKYIVITTHDSSIPSST